MTGFFRQPAADSRNMNADSGTPEHWLKVVRPKENEWKKYLQEPRETVWRQFWKNLQKLCVNGGDEGANGINGTLWLVDNNSRPGSSELSADTVTFTTSEGPESCDSHLIAAFVGVGSYYV